MEEEKTYGRQLWLSLQPNIKQFMNVIKLSEAGKSTIKGLDVIITGDHTGPGIISFPTSRSGKSCN